MAHSYHHAESTAKKFGGKPEDYLAIHNWFDDTKSAMADWRHRAINHHAYGIFQCERLFGVTVTNSEGKNIPVRLIAEQHVREDFGFIPTMAQCLLALGENPPPKWLTRGTSGHLENV